MVIGVNFLTRPTFLGSPNSSQILVKFPCLRYVSLPKIVRVQNLPIPKSAKSAIFSFSNFFAKQNCLFFVLLPTLKPLRHSNYLKAPKFCAQIQALSIVSETILPTSLFYNCPGPKPSNWNRNFLKLSVDAAMGVFKNINGP